MNERQERQMMGSLPGVPLAALLLKALSASEEAGAAVLKIYEAEFDVQVKEDLSPLTLADQLSHEIIVRRLQTDALGTPGPEIPILSEEGRDIPYVERKKWAYFWIIDPLDGTKEFIKRNGEFTINIALVQRDRPVIGVIHVPVKGLSYFAAEGIGAFRLEKGKAKYDALTEGSDITSAEKISDEIRSTGEKFLVPGVFEQILASSTSLPCPPSEGTTGRLTIAGSRSHATEALSGFVQEMRSRYEDVNFISAGSSLKFCLVAEGYADVYPRFGPTMEWDTAAGQCIVEEAGGQVLSMKTGLRLLYNKEDLRNEHFICTAAGNDQDIVRTILR